MTQCADSRPRYAANFRCIGPECEDTCCDGMAVMLDKATYEKYQGLPAGMNQLVQLHVRRNDEATNDALYARIQPPPGEECPFLATDRLCSIQKEHGSGYLSNTCAIYPRALNDVNGTIEASLYLSCPEAARMVLLNSDALEADGEFDDQAYAIGQVSRLASYGSAIHKPYSYFSEVQELMVQLLRDRSRPLWQRLFLLGTLCRFLDGISEPRQDALVPEALRSYREMIEKGTLRGVLDNMPPKPGVQLGIVLRLTDLRLRAGGVGNRFLECWQFFLDGIAYTQESTPESEAEAYLEAERKYYRPFFAQHPHILENYLINYVYRSLFPFGREASAHHTPRRIFDEYMLLISQYAMVKGLLIGMAGCHRENFSTDHVVQLIQSFSRVVEQTPTFQAEISRSVRQWNLATIDGMAALLASAERAPQADIAQASAVSVAFAGSSPMTA